MAKHFDRLHTIGVYEQLAMMRLVHPSFHSAVTQGTLRTRGVIQPTPLNDLYRVRIEYRVGDSPKAFVEDPPLRRRTPEELIPHTYPVDRPCLFLPGSAEWRPDRYIALTIVPWLSEWLFYYEGWHATGEWLGGGVHPEPRSSPEAA